MKLQLTRKIRLKTLKCVDLLFNKSNEYQCKISNFDEIYLPNGYIRQVRLLQCRKIHARNGRSDSTPRILTLFFLPSSNTCNKHSSFLAKSQHLGTLLCSYTKKGKQSFKKDNKSSIVCQSNNSKVTSFILYSPDRPNLFLIIKSKTLYLKIL